MPGTITPEHRQKIAYIYVRQSSQHQVEHNTASQEVQLNLVNRPHYRVEKSETYVNWTKTHIEQIRHKNNIPQFSEQAYQRLGVVNLQQAAGMLDVSMGTVLQLINAHIIQTNQVIKYTPWEIKKSELSKTEVIRYIKSMNKEKRKR